MDTIGIAAHHAEARDPAAYPRLAVGLPTGATMIVTPSILLCNLYGSCGSVTLRRHRGRIVTQPPLSNVPPSAEPPPLAELIIDNTSPLFSIEDGVWDTEPATPDTYGPNYRVSKSQAGNPLARFDGASLGYGQYDILMWWPALPANCVDSMIIHTNDGPADISWVDQTADGGQWNYLARATYATMLPDVYIYHLYAGDHIADAVRFIRVS